jgi:hypothetical protein
LFAIIQRSKKLRHFSLTLNLINSEEQIRKGNIQAISCFCDGPNLGAFAAFWHDVINRSAMQPGLLSQSDCVNLVLIHELLEFVRYQ